MEGEQNRNEKMGRFISKLRKERGLTQKELAKQLGVTDKAVSKWERAASSPDIGLLIPLAEILGVSTGELLRGERAADSAKEHVGDMVEEALKYSQSTSTKKLQKMQSWILVGVSVAALAASIICLICDYAVSGELSWSIIVLVTLVAVWILLFCTLRAKDYWIRKGLLALTLLIFPYLAVLSILLKAPLLRTMGCCIGAAAILGVWGLYSVIVHEWNRRRYFAIGMLCSIAIAEEYGINLIIDGFLGVTATEKSFVYLECIIMLLLAAASFVIGICKEHRKE